MAKLLVSVGVVVFCGFSVWTDPGQPRSKGVVYHPPIQERWAIGELRGIEDRLRNGRISLAKAGELVRPILSDDPQLRPVFESVPGVDERHKAIHFVMFWFEEEPNFPDFERQYVEATGHRYICRGQCERVK